MAPSRHAGSACFKPRRAGLATRRRQRGASLLEALVAFLVLSLGMLSMARLQNQLRLHADVARQRSEAVRLAQEDIESMRAFASVTPRAATASYDEIAPASRAIATLNGETLNTRYELRRVVAASDAPRLKAATVTVEWVDRSGTAQQVVLDTIIAGHDPALSAALSLRGAGRPLFDAARRPASAP